MSTASPATAPKFDSSPANLLFIYTSHPLVYKMDDRSKRAAARPGRNGKVNPWVLSTKKYVSTVSTSLGRYVPTRRALCYDLYL